VLSERFGPPVRQWMLGVGGALARRGVSPNLLTVVGLALNVGVAAVIAAGHPRVGGVLLLLASAFDMLDGAVARADGRVTRFGGFLDSTLDRYSEIVVFLGLLVYLLGTPDARTGSILVFVAAAGALMISYARARAEAAGVGASVGVLPRPERIVLLAVCLIVGKPLIALWVLAVLTHLTAAMRIVHVWQASERDPVPGAERP
jgi:CDP-diacylglycerol---glycerol-3-phosphate 3-phosphatidyltransferase